MSNCTFLRYNVVDPKWVEGLDIPQILLLCRGFHQYFTSGDFDFRWQDGSLENPYSIRQAGVLGCHPGQWVCGSDTTIVQDVFFSAGTTWCSIFVWRWDIRELDIPYDIVGWDDGSIDPHRILGRAWGLLAGLPGSRMSIQDSMQVGQPDIVKIAAFMYPIFLVQMGMDTMMYWPFKTNCTLSHFFMADLGSLGAPLVFSTQDPSASWDGRSRSSL